MAHYAKVKEGKVVEVIVADATFFDTFVDNTPGEWIQTSYNTRGNIHYKPNSDEPSPIVYLDSSGSTFFNETSASVSGSLPITASDTSQTLALRGNYAGIGFTYDSTHDAFYAPQPYNSWILDTGSFNWDAPVSYPTGDATGSYTGSYKWSESDLNWITGSI
tara:strand:- start:391 stop:876 length:486 start_codon:yes stop_codon:yes gene_type:complete